MENTSITTTMKKSLLLLVVLMINIVMVGAVMSQTSEDKPTIFVDPPTYVAKHRVRFSRLM